MWIVCYADDLPEMLSLTGTEKNTKKKKKSNCPLLQFLQL